MDMVMLALLNAQERTEDEFRELFRAADEGFVFKVRSPFLFHSFLPPRCPPGGVYWRDRGIGRMADLSRNEKQGVTRPEGCRMSIVEAVWKPDEVQKEASPAAVEEGNTANTPAAAGGDGPAQEAENAEEKTAA
jgi:hypothetical protein